MKYEYPGLKFVYKYAISDGIHIILDDTKNNYISPADFGGDTWNIDCSCKGYFDSYGYDIYCSQEDLKRDFLYYYEEYLESKFINIFTSYHGTGKTTPFIDEIQGYKNCIRLAKKEIDDVTDLITLQNYYFHDLIKERLIHYFYFKETNKLLNKPLGEIIYNEHRGELKRNSYPYMDMEEQNKIEYQLLFSCVDIVNLYGRFNKSYYKENIMDYISRINDGLSRLDEIIEHLRKDK